jgi:hypothetical protein
LGVSEAEAPVTPVQPAEFPRKTLVVPSAIGFLTLLVIGFLGHRTPEFAVWPLLGCFAAVAVIEVFTVPPAIWKLSSSPAFRTRANLLSVGIALAFLLVAIVQFLI